MTSFIFFGCGYFNFSKNYFYGNISYLRQDVKPLLQKILNKGKNDKIYLYYGAIETYSYYSLIYPLPKDFYFEIYPEDENFSELSLQKDLENLSKGTYYLLFIKGTGTYEKDVNYIEPWLKSHYKILSIDTLKSTKLIKFKVE